MIGSILFALMVAALGPASSAAAPTIREADADPQYQRVETRQLSGHCSDVAELAQLLKDNDGVNEVIEVSCDGIVFTPPSDGAENESEGLMAFVTPEKKQGVYFRGHWSKGDFNLTRMSFDQQNWHDVSSGRVRVYRKTGGDETIFMVFAVFQQETTRGVAFAFTG